MFDIRTHVLISEVCIAGQVWCGGGKSEVEGNDQMVMTLDRPIVDASSVALRVSEQPDSDFVDVGRAITSALMSRIPATFTIEADSVSSVTGFASPLRLFLLMSGRNTGGVSATVAPHFSEETYPALLDLVSRLDGSGASELWRPDGARTVALGDAKQMFISADMPVAERSMRPNRLLEVVAAHRIPADWYRARVAPRLSNDSPVRVFYGLRGSSGSAFAEADAEAMAEEAMTGERRRFSLPQVGG